MTTNRLPEKQDPSESKANLRADSIAWLFICIYALCFFLINFLQYHNFKYRDYDLAVHAQTMWAMIHGSTYSSILGASFLGNHINLILFLITPIYFLIPHPLTLIALQAICLSLAAYPIYAIAKEELGRRLGLGILAVYFFYPPLVYANLYEFHPTAFATLFLALMFFAYARKQFRRFLLFMILALLCQENIPLLVIPVGLYAFFDKRKLRWILTPLLVAGFWFLITVVFPLPLFKKDTIKHILIYSQFGASMPEIIRFLVEHPLTVAKTLITQTNYNYLLNLFMPLSFFCLADWRILMIFPTLLQHLLSKRPSEHTIFFHYTTEMVPFIFFAAVYGFKRVLSYLRMRNPRRPRPIMPLVALAIIVASYTVPYKNISARLMGFKKNAWDVQEEKFLCRIPADASVVATFKFLPKLSQRRQAYSFHHVVSGFFSLSDKPYRLPPDVQYALLDFDDPLTFNSFYNPASSDLNLRKFFEENTWAVVDAVNSLVLLKKGGLNDFVLYRTASEIPQNIQKLNAVIENQIELVGYETPDSDNPQTGKLKLRFFWKAVDNVRGDFMNFFEIVNKTGKLKYSVRKPICYRIYPTYRWKKGEILEENFNLFLPPNVEPSHSIFLGFYNTRTGRTERLLLKRGSLQN